MNTMIWIALTAAVALSVGCSKKETKAAGGSDEGASSIPECDQYFVAVEKCAKKMPGNTGETMKKGMETTKKAIKLSTTPEAKKAQAEACKRATEALEKNPACK